MGLKQMIANKTKSCTVASPRVCNSATFSESTVNLCNLQCNSNATHSVEPLINKDSTRNQQCNHYATVQKTDVQLLPLKTPEKLHTKNEELHVKITENTPLGGGDNFVILANSTNAQAANDPPPKGEVKPVIPKTVRQVEPQHKSELLALLAANGHYEKIVVEKSYPQTEDGQHYPKSVVKKSHATNELLTHYEKPLFYHLLACSYCHVLRGEYCINGYAMGSVYDALLLNRDDAQARRESLALRVDRACISGRSVFVPFSRIDAPPPPMKIAPITRKYGNTPEYEAFINHWTACKVCKPNLGRYCSEGQRLEKEANSSYQ